tara:strand:- start:50 stop:580 length:531 start_codon:yes stop_codon:yes gene_type:complete
MAIIKTRARGLKLDDNFAFTGTITGAGEVNTPCFYATMSAHQDLSDNVSAKVAFNQTSFATSGTYNTSTYRFTPAVAGIYQFHVCVVGDSQGSSELYANKVYLFKNGSAISHQSDGVTFNFVSNYARQAPITHNITDTADTDDYYEVYVQVNDTSGNPRAFRYGSYFSGFRIGTSA